jgi:hypothetical protein
MQRGPTGIEDRAQNDVLGQGLDGLVRTRSANTTTGQVSTWSTHPVGASLPVSTWATMSSRIA